MKVDFFLALFLVFFVVDNVNSGAIDPSLKLVTLEDLAEGEEINFEEFEKEYERSKRSGLGSTEALLGSLKFILAQGAKAKLGLLGKASAGVASSVASASGSKALAYGYPSYLPPGKGDPWSMKKAVLNTLFQAVKAIKGGVLAIKGQLLKGGGYLLAGGGKLVTAKGEVITNLGKKLAKSAFGGSHPDYSSEVHEVGSYGHFQPSGYEYGAPAVHGPDHFQPGFPDDKPSGPQSGILILKKIPSAKQELTDSKVGFVGKFLSAASSLSPESPVPFTDYKHSHPQPLGDDHAYSDNSEQQDHGNLHSVFAHESTFDSDDAAKVVEPAKTGQIYQNHFVQISENVEEDPPAPQEPQNDNFKLPIDIGQDFAQINQQYAALNAQQSNGQGKPSDFFEVNIRPGEHNFAAPPVRYQDFPKLQTTNFNQFSNQAGSSTIFGHNFAEPPKLLFKSDKDDSNSEEPDQEQDQSPDEFGKFEEAPRYLTHGDLTVGEIKDQSQSSSSNVINKKLPDYISATLSDSSKKNQLNYNLIRGSIISTPTINSQAVNPSSNLDLPDFSRQLAELLRNEKNAAAFPPYHKARPSSSKKPTPHSSHSISHRRKPSSHNKKSRHPSNPKFSRLNSSTRSKSHSLHSFNDGDSVNYQLGSNGPEMI